MPILDAALVFSAAQSVALNATSANSTNVIDLQAAGLDVNGNTAPSDLGQSVGMMAPEIDVRFTTALLGGTSLQIQAVNADSADLATNPKVVAETLTLTADGTLGARARIGGLGPGCTKRYLGLIFTTVGNMTAGNVNASLLAQRYP